MGYTANQQSGSQANRTLSSKATERPTRSGGEGPHRFDVERPQLPGSEQEDVVGGVPRDCFFLSGVLT